MTLMRAEHNAEMCRMAPSLCFKATLKNLRNSSGSRGRCLFDIGPLPGGTHTVGNVTSLSL